MHPIQDVNVREMIPLLPPRQLIQEQPLSQTAAETVSEMREAVKRIMDGSDRRVMAIVGPCSIHDERKAIEYAGRLRNVAERIKDRLLVIMRVYFEKPRTTVGWKGLINDPQLDGTFDIETGLRIARRILLHITEAGLPTATEMLEPITPQYLADLITLASLGARTTESPTHREMASGLSMPVGYKNSTDGRLQVAIDAMLASQAPHSFLGINSEGDTCIVHTRGNPWGHLILRGGRSGPNYYADRLEAAAEKLAAAGLSPRLVVDCSHANSGKDYRKQARVWRDVIRQRVAGNDSIIGMMLESNLVQGSQKLGDDPSKLKYGVSITDSCIGWEETENLLLEAHQQLGG
jgi:3-deoxy-7-phosphoheptulonate synthase